MSKLDKLDRLLKKRDKLERKIRVVRAEALLEFFTGEGRDHVR